MGIIYKEMVRHKRASFSKWAVLLLMFVLTVNVLVNSAHYSKNYDIAIEILLLLGGTLSAAMLKMGFDMAYTKRICYMYKLIDKELIFERVIGGSKKFILSIDMKNVETFAPRCEVKNIRNVDRTYKFLCSPSPKNIYCCVVNDKGRQVKVCFQPSDELVKKLKVVMGQRSETVA